MTYEAAGRPGGIFSFHITDLLLWKKELFLSIFLGTFFIVVQSCDAGSGPEQGFSEVYLLKGK